MEHGRRQERVRTALVLALTAVLLIATMAWLNPQVLPSPLRHALGLDAERLGPLPPVGDATSYKFIATQSDGRPVTYNPCQVLRVEVNPRGGPGVGDRLVREAMERIEEATGLRLEYAGTTDREPRWSAHTVPVVGTPQPALVSWATADEVPQLAGDVAGIGGSVWPDKTRGQVHFITGQVTLDIDAFDEILSRPQGLATARGIVYHEFGHLVGLDHVADPTQLMYARPLLRRGGYDFGAGDLAGLALLGRGSC